MNIDDFTKKQQEEEKEQKLKKLKPLFDIRITIAKEGREAFLKKEYVLAASKYHQYLGIYADYNDVDTIFKLTPSMFDTKQHMSELFLISQVYWDLTKINQLTPRLSENFQRSLNQFVAFTINQPYQVLNAEILRKHIKKTKLTNPRGQAELQSAHKNIYVQSKSCFIATYLFAKDDPVVIQLRNIRNTLLNFWVGQLFVISYYKHSEKFILLSKRSLFIRTFLKVIVRPVLKCLSTLGRV